MVLPAMGPFLVSVAGVFMRDFGNELGGSLVRGGGAGGRAGPALALGNPLADVSSVGAPVD